MPSPVTTLIIGLGETGSDLARRLAGHVSVVCVEIDPGRADRARAELDPGDLLRIEAGDATSALVLRRLELGTLRAAVACTDSDETNLEALRVVEAVYPMGRRIALLRSSAARGAYEADGVEIAPRARACASLLEKQLDVGTREATGIGLGRGEIREVTVMASSPLVGRPLDALHPRRWLVAAVYREEELIVPHGDTRLAAGDRVILVGEPSLLPSVAEMLRSGEPEFPFQYGTHVVVLHGRELPAVLEESSWLVGQSHADKLEAVACDLPEPAVDELSRRCRELGVAHEFSCVAGSTEESLADEARRRDVGVLVVAPEPLGLWARLGFARSHTARLLDHIASPLLIARGSHPYRRVLLALPEPIFHPSAAQLAFDLVGTLGGELTLGVVHQPPLVVGPEGREALEERRREIEAVASLWRTAFAVQERQGNPVHEVLAMARDFDLVILSRARRQRASLTRPDVALHLAHRLPCSAMVLPFAEEPSPS